MTLVCVLAESSVDIAGAGPHVETLHESWPGRPLANDDDYEFTNDLYEFTCPVPEIRAATADLKIGVTVNVVHPVALKAANDRWLALSELRRAQDGASWEIRLTQPFWRREQSDDQKTGDN